MRLCFGIKLSIFILPLPFVFSGSSHRPTSELVTPEIRTLKSNESTNVLIGCTDNHKRMNKYFSFYCNWYKQVPRERAGGGGTGWHVPRSAKESAITQWMWKYKTFHLRQRRATAMHKGITYHGFFNSEIPGLRKCTCVVLYSKILSSNFQVTLNSYNCVN